MTASGHYDDGNPQHDKSPQLDFPTPHADSMSQMDNCNVSDLIPPRKSSIAVQSPRLIHYADSRRWLRMRLATGFDIFGSLPLGNVAV
jgi:hypothetical protein